MKLYVSIVILSAIAIFAIGSADDEEEEEDEEDDTQAQTGLANRMEDMMFCLNQEKVPESEMRNFIRAKESSEVKESLKKGILCFAKRINFFDGTTWNMTVIEESEAKNPQMLKDIKECLEKDDPAKEPHERAYLVQKCITNKEDYEDSD